MNERAKLMKRMSAVQFSLWELHLYLDTHPTDKSAMECHKKHSKMFEELREQYEKKFGPLTPATGHGTAWTKDPWPWDLEECVR